MEATLDKLEKKHGGTRKGAGMPKGKKTRKTIEKEMAIARIRERVFNATDVLIDGQLNNARGVSYLYKIEKTKVVGPKGGISYRSERPKIVTNQFEIEEYLAGLIENGDENDEKDSSASYYFITTEKPETSAAKELWDRALGKSPQAITDADGESLVIAFDMAFKKYATLPAPSKDSE